MKVTKKIFNHEFGIYCRKCGSGFLLGELTRELSKQFLEEWWMCCPFCYHQDRWLIDPAIFK